MLHRNLTTNMTCQIDSTVRMGEKRTYMVAAAAAGTVWVEKELTRLAQSRNSVLEAQDQVFRKTEIQSAGRGLLYMRAQPV